jgi:chitin disaccharide deacetylase
VKHLVRSVDSSPVPRLIINADDLGINAQRSHGIFQCMEFGVVTSASIFTTFADSETAARHANERGFSVGLHLNLTEDYPLSTAGDVASLLDGNGRFFERDKLWGLIDDGQIKSEHLEREIRAQLEWCFDHDLQLTHVSGNYDCHVHRAIASALMPLMERYGVRFVRIPCEEPIPPHGYIIPTSQLEDIGRINQKAKEVRELFAGHGIGCTDHFRGLSLLGNASLKNLRHTLSRLPDGTTELMVHPGSQCSYGSPFDLDPQRQTELRMLLDESIQAELTERKIELITYADL